MTYDFEAWLRKRTLGLTIDQMIDCSHFPVSIATNDSLTKELIFIENRDAKHLIKESVTKLTHRQETISGEVWNRYPMVDESSLPGQVVQRWTNWANQASVFGFNSENMILTL